MFEAMDEQLLDSLCDCLKPVFHPENSYIVWEREPITEMSFFMRGKLLTMTTTGRRAGFVDSYYLNGGDFCGEELLTWALDPHSSSNLPIPVSSGGVTAGKLSTLSDIALCNGGLGQLVSYRQPGAAIVRRSLKSLSGHWPRLVGAHQV